MCLVVGYLMVVHNNIPDMTIICIIHVHTSCRQSHLPWTRMPPFFCLFVCSVFIVVCLPQTMVVVRVCIFGYYFFVFFFSFHLRWWCTCSFVLANARRVSDPRMVWCVFIYSTVSPKCEFAWVPNSVQWIIVLCDWYICTYMLRRDLMLNRHNDYTDSQKKRVEKEIYILTLDLVMFHVEIKPIIIGNVDLWW